MNERDWIDVLQALLTPAIALFVAYLAWRQYQIQQQRVRMDLFDRRYQIFESTMDYITKTIAKSKFDENLYKSYLNKIRGAQFIFSKDLYQYLLKIRNESLDIWVQYEYLAEFEFTGGDKNSFRKRKYDKMIWIGNQLEEVEERFRPYMQIEQRHWLSRSLRKFTPSSS